MLCILTELPLRTLQYYTYVHEELFLFWLYKLVDRQMEKKILGPQSNSALLILLKDFGLGWNYLVEHCMSESVGFLWLPY